METERSTNEGSGFFLYPRQVEKVKALQAITCLNHFLFYYANLSIIFTLTLQEVKSECGCRK